jgi:hypothetical protein
MGDLLLTPFSAAFKLNSSHLSGTAIFGSADSTACVVDLRAGEIMQEWKIYGGNAYSSLRCMAHHSDSNFLAAGFRFATICHLFCVIPPNKSVLH